MFPAASRATTTSVRSRSIRGMRSAPGPSARIVRRAPLTRHVERRRLGDPEPRRLRRDDPNARRRRVEDERELDGRRARRRRPTSTAATYEPSRAWPRRLRPSHVTTCAPGPSGPSKGVATQRPSRRIRTVSAGGSRERDGERERCRRGRRRSASCAGEARAMRPERAGEHDGHVGGGRRGRPSRSRRRGRRTRRPAGRVRRRRRSAAPARRQRLRLELGDRRAGSRRRP